MDYKAFFSKNKYSIIILLFTFLFYGNSINNHYSFSDSYVINKQTQKGISAIPEIFTTRYFKEYKINYGYRPITKTTFAIEYSLFGQSPRISHFFNVLFFAILGLILFKTLKLIFENIKYEFLLLVVLIFLAHPAQTEVVASLKNREEILMFLFGISTIRAVFNYFNYKKWYYILCALIFLILGYWTKPSVSILIASLPLFLFFSSKINIKKALLIYLFLGVFLFVISRIPNQFLDRTSRQFLFQENPLVDADFPTKIGTGLGIMLFYLKKLLLPYPLSFYYGYNTIPVLKIISTTSIISFIIYLTSNAFAFIKLKKKSVLSLAILGFSISVFLYSNIITKNIAGIVADRYMLIPSLFFSIILIYLIFKITKTSINKNEDKINRKVFYIILIIIIPYFVIDYNRNTQWDTASSLIEHDIKHLKSSAMANEIYATNKLNSINKLKTNTEKKEALEKSIKHYKISLKIYPKYKFSLSSLANIYFVYYKDYNKAAKYYIKYLEIDSTEFNIIKNTGFCFDKMKDYEKSIYFYKKALQLKPNDFKTISLIANKYYFINDKEKGDFFNKKLLNIKPNSEIPYINTANYFFMQKDTTKAIELYQKALNTNPNNLKLKSLLEAYYSLHNKNIR